MTQPVCWYIAPHKQKRDHEPFSHLAAMGKLYAAEAATNVTRRCVQLADYNGYSKDFPFERLMRDAKITVILGVFF